VTAAIRGVFGEVDIDAREEAEPVVHPVSVSASTVTGPIPVLVPRMAVADRVALGVAAVMSVVCVALFVIAADLIIGGAS